MKASTYEGVQLRGPLEDDSSPVLYTHVLCPYAQRAWLALLEKVKCCFVSRISLVSPQDWTIVRIYSWRCRA